MTFDEFLIKKKIDRNQFGLAEPALLAEFAHDYAQMGEKSFDHTKKYWFNQLRRKYKLAEVAKVEMVKEVTEAALVKDETVVNLVAEPAQPKPVFKPRFQAGKTSAPKPQPESVETENSGIKEASPVQPENKVTNASPKPAFKPRFAAGKTGMAKSVEEDDAARPKPGINEAPTLPEQPTVKPKPGFKPRFKPPEKPKD